LRGFVCHKYLKNFNSTTPHTQTLKALIIIYSIFGIYASMLLGSYVVLEYKIINKVTILKYIIKPIMQLLEAVLQKKNIELKN